MMLYRDCWFGVDSKFAILIHIGINPDVLHNIKFVIRFTFIFILFRNEVIIGNFLKVNYIGCLFILIHFHFSY